MAGLTENQIIQRIQELVVKPEDGILGIGDDCAAIPSEKLQGRMLLTTDSLIEGTHFLRHLISPEDLAYKSLAVNLSDIAAMGGRPGFVLLSLALPKELAADWIDDFLRGFAESARHFGVGVIGGNTARSGEIGIHVTATGTVEESRLKLRSGARSGDILCVTKTLGDSAVGFTVLHKNLKGERYSAVIERHCRPFPHIEEGRFLSGEASVHAMMDLSDGLLSDLPKIASAAARGVRIDLEDLPISPDVSELAGELAIDSCDSALVGGEDYALLAAVEETEFADLSARYKRRFGLPLIRIGSVTSGGIVFFKQGREYFPEGKSFQHF